MFWQLQSHPTNINYYCCYSYYDYNYVFFPVRKMDGWTAKLVKRDKIKETLAVYFYDQKIFEK